MASKMTDEERMELAQKLDKDFEDFLDEKIHKSSANKNTNDKEDYDIDALAEVKFCLVIQGVKQ